MPQMIETKDLTFQYQIEGEESCLVLNGINLSIEQGQFVAFLGHNGSGKSTLAKHFNAMLLPSGGSCLVLGMDTMDGEKKYDIRQSVGMVLQNPDNQMVATIVEEDVAFAPENLGVEPEEIRRRVDDALKAVDMYERVAIAGVIAMQPKCIVLDEPTAMLDPKGRSEVMSTIRALNKDLGITVVLITHYMEEAVQADRVVVVDDGQILLDGTPREVFSQVKLLKSVELDVPQATRLLYRLEEAGVQGLPKGVLDDEECIEVLSHYLEVHGCR